MKKLDAEHAARLIREMSKTFGAVELEHTIKERSDGPYLLIKVASPSENLFRVLRDAQDRLPDNQFTERAAIIKREKAPTDRLRLPEAQLLKSTLSDSLTVDRYTFSSDFFGRYTRSVFAYEDQIVSSGNYLVYGRRGSGKSSLLAYAMHKCRQDSLLYAWIDMQAYSDRTDVQVSIDVILDIVRQIEALTEVSSLLSQTRLQLEELAELQDDALAERDLKRAIPRIKRILGEIAQIHGDISLFIDDIHVLGRDFQSQFLSHLYAISRGNRCNLKISGIEQFSHPWDSSRALGLQPPHDAQVLKLDYNLTMPDRSRDHIESILDSHARFSGLPSVSYVCGEGVIGRLVWVAAAVPRDALNLFSQAITKASAKGERRVSITAINAAASEMAEQKLRDMQQDAGKAPGLDESLARVKTFCINEKKKNAFLLEIRNEDALFRSIQQLIALRLVHVLHEGITPHQAGRRYQALLLDYGFYVGIRAAKSVDLFQKEPKTPTAKELRNLPVLELT